MKSFFASALMILTIILSSCHDEVKRPHELSSSLNTKQSGSKAISSLSSSFRKFSSLDSSILDALKMNKKVLLYFTGKFCVFARIMETQVFTDESIRSALSNEYLVYLIDIDNRTTEGKQNAHFLLSQFHANSLPFFAILDEKGQTVRTSAFTAEVSAFRDFLR